MEFDELDVAVEIFHQRGAAFHPVTAVKVRHVVDGLNFRAVDVSADDALHIVFAGHLQHGVLVLRDVFHR